MYLYIFLKGADLGNPREILRNSTYLNGIVEREETITYSMERFIHFGKREILGDNLVIKKDGIPMTQQEFDRRYYEEQ